MNVDIEDFCELIPADDAPLVIEHVGKQMRYEELAEAVAAALSEDEKAAFLTTFLTNFTLDQLDRSGVELKEGST